VHGQRHHRRISATGGDADQREIFSAFLGEYREFKTFFHGHTYTGNPLGCAAAIANLEIFQRDNVIENMQPRIVYLQKRLREEFLALSHVSDVRQWGYMIGIELAQDRAGRKNYAPEKRTGHQVFWRRASAA
jgi:adenosylmethionine-8-amino-7-oxononanoate aminotransferase